MIEKTYKIPDGSESIIDNMVAIGVERYLKTVHAEKPVEEKIEYQEAVNEFRKDNNMEDKFVIAVKPVVEEPIVEKPIEP